MTFSYHPKSFDLLKAKPKICKENLECLDRIERMRNFRFPEAFKEWYSLEGAVALLKHGGMHPYPIEVLVSPQELGNSGQVDYAALGLLPFLYEEQGVCHWALQLDGSQDPPVLVEVDSEPEYIWQTCSPNFSTFVYCAIWEQIGESESWIQAQDVELKREDLNFLRQTFVEEPSTFGWPGENNYRFSRADQKILIWARKGSSDWCLSAKTSESLRQLVETVYRCGNLAKTMYGKSDIEDTLLRKTRQKRE
jgi:hypothetical protein